LSDAQLVVAREYRFESWPKLKLHVQALAQRPLDRPSLEQYERIAESLRQAYSTGDQTAMEVVWNHFGHRRTWETMRRYVALDLGKAPHPDQAPADITLSDLVSATS